MRKSANFRASSGLLPGAALLVLLVPFAGCPSAQPLPNARATTLQSAAPPAREAARRGGVRTTVDVRYYNVAGRSEGDLLVAMQRGGPQWAGRRFFGLTNTALQFGYRHAVDARACRTLDVSILAEVTVTLPRWDRPPGTPYALDRDWRSFERALRHHEDGHRVLAEREAAALDRELSILRATSCAELDTYANHMADEVRARFAAQHEAYDRQTEHGRSQGAAWPRDR